MARLAEMQTKHLPHVLESTTPSETLPETSRRGSRHGIGGVPSTFGVKNGITWSATQVRLRRVKAGLGGHEEGVGGVDDGVANASPPMWKRVRTTTSECPTFSDFTGVANDVANENRNNCSETARQEVSRLGLF